MLEVNQLVTDRLLLLALRCSSSCVVGVVANVAEKFPDIIVNAFASAACLRYNPDTAPSYAAFFVLSHPFFSLCLRSIIIHMTLKCR